MRRVLTLLAAACMLSGSVAIAAPPTRTPNSARYAVAHPSSTGRAGSAALSVDALLSSNGQVEVVATASAMADVTPASAEIAKLQTKILDDAGKVLESTQVSGDGGARLVTEAFGLRRGQLLQLQANIRGIDGRRTDVVTVTEQVRLRPDLAVEQVQGPGSVMLGAYAHIDAVVRELNGDTGATANCVLREGATELDRAVGIWVDGGDTVSCAFALAFDAGGEHVLTVSVEDAAPWDDDPSNDVGTVMVDVRAGTPMTASGTVSDYDLAKTFEYWGSWTLRQGDGHQAAQWDYYDTQEGWNQSVSFSARSDQAIAFPLATISLDQSSAGASHPWHLANVDATSVSSSRGSTVRCAWEQHSVDASSLQVCSYEPFTAGAASGVTVDYRKRAGMVVYHSIGVEQLWYVDGAGASTELGSWSWNEVDVAESGQRWPVGEVWQWRLSLSDAAGTNLYANADASVGPSLVRSGHPLSCRTGPSGGYMISICYGTSNRYDMLSGSTSGL